MKIVLVLALLAGILWMLSIVPVWVFALFAAWLLVKILAAVLFTPKAPPTTPPSE